MDKKTVKAVKSYKTTISGDPIRVIDIGPAYLKTYADFLKWLDSIPAGVLKKQLPMEQDYPRKEV